jgi:hypothetical protein
MENLFIAATPSSPEVSFDFTRHVLSLKGESYPENAAVFYGEAVARLRKYLSDCDGASVTVNVALTYFNSSSTKMLFSMFDALNEAAERGNESACTGSTTRTTTPSSSSARNCTPISPPSTSSTK